VAPPFHYVEKGDENVAAISFSATLFLLLRQAGNKISWQNFMKLCIFSDTKFCKINIKISQNTN
jgi:hypothetical protein